MPDAPTWVIDDVLDREFPIYTRGNVGEVFPAVVSPLTWSSYGRASDLGWRDAFEALGALRPGELSADHNVIVAVFGGYAYLNVSAIRLLAVRTPGMTVDDLDQGIFGEQEAPPYEPRPADRDRRGTARIVRNTLSVLRARSLPDLEADKADVDRWLGGLPGAESGPDADILGAIDGYAAVHRRLFARHILVSFQVQIATSLLAQVCADRLGDPSLPVTLLGGIGEVESAAPSAALWDLAECVADDGVVGALFDGGLEDLHERIADEPKAADFRARFGGFVERFGSRGPNEWEGSAPTWETHPVLAYTAIDRMRGAASDHSPRDKQAELGAAREVAVAEARARLNPVTRFAFDRALRASTLYSQGRERSKTTIIRAIHGLRLLQRELARRAAERGGAPRIEDFWLLTRAELGPYLDDPAGHRAVIEERAELRDRLAGLVPPFVFEGTQPPPDTWASRTDGVDAVAAGTTLNGIPGCPGVARGRARVVTDPADPGDLGPGDVLVAPITDPSWTPLFVPAEAVVVDVGAQLSHAVIVSRELGLPCVVSVTDATRRIPDGAVIEVDGSAGQVRIIEVPEG